MNRFLRNLQVISLCAVALTLPASLDARRPHFIPEASRLSHADHGWYYTNVSGHSVHRPVQSVGRPPGATAHCRDGSWSFSEHHRGTCSHHGGVAEFM